MPNPNAYTQNSVLHKNIMYIIIIKDNIYVTDTLLAKCYII